MAVIPFPIGGKDLAYYQARRVSVASVEAYLRLSDGHPELTSQLERALRIQQDGYCYLLEELEMSVFSLVGT